MKNKLKKLLIIGIIIGFLGIGSSFTYGDEEAFPYDNRNPSQAERREPGKTDLGNNIDIKSQDSIINRLLDVFGINTELPEDHKFLHYAKTILNIALGLLSMIALVMTIYTFYMMFFTENDAGIKKAKGNLVGIFIALAIIGLSWLIVSFIFRWYQSNWETALPVTS